MFGRYRQSRTEMSEETKKLLVSEPLPSGCPAVVAVVTDAMYPYFMGGKEVLYHHVVRGLAERGLEVHLFTMHWWNGSANKVEGGVHYHALCRVYALYHGTRRSILEALMFSLACLRLIGHRYDIIYADHMPHLPLFTIRLIASVRRVPLVVTWHEVWGYAYWREYLGPLGAIAATVEAISMKLPDRLIAVSGEVSKQLQARGVPANRITVIPNGVDLALITSVTASPQHYDFLFVGRLLEHKRVDQLIEAVASLYAEGINATCAIVGEGPEEPRLKSLRVRLGVVNQVTFIANLPDHAEIFGLMKSAKVLVLPSVREGFGIVVAEAIACGLPVITTNHQENHAQELVEDGVTGWICAPTVDGIAEALRDALAGGAARRVPDPGVRERYDWRSFTARLIDVFVDSSRN
jgi:glycosyltransferase involved in cell wall biosynthesis